MMPKLIFQFPTLNGKSFVRLNSEIVEEEIKKSKISNLVSQVSKNKAVREKGWYLFRNLMERK